MKNKPSTPIRQKGPSENHLHQLAFDNSFLANIISVVQGDKIIDANLAAGKLLGFSHEELVTKNLKDLFTSKDECFTELMQERTLAGHAFGNLILIKKNGKSLPCQTTSVVFTGDSHIQKAITTLIDRTETIRRQKAIDQTLEKRLATEKRLARSDSDAALNRMDNLEHQLDDELTAKEYQIASAVTNAKETERSDLGKELHDNVNQLLAASRLYMDMARKHKGKRELYLSQSSEYTLTAIEEIRKLSKGLISDVVLNLGLCDAIKQMTSDIMEAYPVRISCRMDKDIHLQMSPKFNLNIYRIVQEQLNNIIKHAKSSIVIINLSRNKENIILSIGDNGVGFVTAGKMKGIGIRNIKSRAAVYDGSASFVSNPGKGCVLTVSFPVLQIR